MANDSGRDAGVAKIRELIEDIKFATLTTVAKDGSLHGRPMSTMQTEFDGDVWFFTKASASQASEIAGDSHASVSYANPDDNTWVVLSGTATLSRDKAKMKELWTDHLKAYFPEGLDDPDIALIKVSVDRGEYWEGPGMVAYALEVAASIVTGKQAHPGDHEKVAVK